MYSFIKILCEIPVRLNKYLYNRKSGFGLIINVKKRLIIISRAVVLYNLYNIIVIIATFIFVERKIGFLYPITNFAII
jgi:pro-apoptotic serine protease NMA111